MSETDTQATGTVAPSTTEDTAPTQPSEASEQTVETPEAQPTQNTKEEAQVTDTVTEKLFAGKYKSADDLEKSYLELQRKQTQDAMEKAELTRILNEAFLAPESAKTEQQEDTQTDDYREEDTRSTGPDQRVDRDLAVMKFVIMHSDANPDAMKEVLASDKLVSQIPGYENKLEYAYKVSQNLSHEKALEQARQEAYTQAQAKTAEKEIAKVETAQKAESADDKAELMTKATTGSPEERKAARNALIRKHLTTL